jgi:hypothetical protein
MGVAHAVYLITAAARWPAVAGGRPVRALTPRPDYHRHPRWDLADPDNVDRAMLPRTAELRARLEASADAYAAVLNPDDPAVSDSPSEQAARAVDAGGARRWRALAAPRGPGYATRSRRVARRAVLPAPGPPAA